MTRAVENAPAATPGHRMPDMFHESELPLTSLVFSAAAHRYLRNRDSVLHDRSASWLRATDHRLHDDAAVLPPLRSSRPAFASACGVRDPPELAHRPAGPVAGQPWHAGWHGGGKRSVGAAADRSFPRNRPICTAGADTPRWPAGAGHRHNVLRRLGVYEELVFRLLVLFTLLSLLFRDVDPALQRLGRQSRDCVHQRRWPSHATIT